MLFRKLSHWTAAVLHRGVARYYLRKPELTELIAIKFPTLGSIPCALLNEIAFLRRAPKSFRLTSLNIEVTNFCNLACSFCPVNRGMERKKRYLDPALFRRVIDATQSAQAVAAQAVSELRRHIEVAS